MTVHQPCTKSWRIVAFFSLQNNLRMLVGFLALTTYFGSSHNIFLRLKSGLPPKSTSDRTVLRSFMCVLGSLAAWPTFSSFSSWTDHLTIMASHPCPKAINQAHKWNKVLVLECSFVFQQIEHFLFKPKGSTLVSSIHRTLFSSLLAYQCGLWQTVDWQQCSFWRVWLSSYILWTMSFTNARQFFSSLDIVMGFYEISWNIIHLTVGVTLLDWLLLRRITMMLNCLHLLLNLPNKGLVKTKLIGNSFITFQHGKDQ